VSERTITVESPARLHFGLLDLRGGLGRRFGGIGAAAPEITVRISVSPADGIQATGPDAARAAEFARRFLGHHRLTGGATVRVERAIPAHAGLGSGTQLALSIGHALAALHGVSATAPDIARAVGRAKRSAVGTWTFAGGGFVVEGGRRTDREDDTGPMLARLPFPAGWRCVVALPRARPGISGAAEAAAFASLPLPDEREVERVSHLVLMAMLPALADGDLATFGAALTEVQELNGRWFSAAQGGTFAPGASSVLVRRMREWGATGVGQSSWGPAVYAIVDGDDAALDLARRVRDVVGDDGSVHAGAFPSTGARLGETTAP
jgi:beta-ribofuranosylaminobenzene 5'-phosphate synthase